MDVFHDINWSAVAREAIKRKLLMLERFKEFTNESTLSEEEALELGRRVSEKAMKKHRAR
ncbi:MAG TPA: hypothetical protein VJC16_02610 [Candidatus Nanoarchaeia archaeon]|nr:hypothetical protein [Candidatus Nanoarchaeia archaeon]